MSAAPMPKPGTFALAEALRLHELGFWPIPNYPRGALLGNRRGTSGEPQVAIGKEPIGRDWGAERWTPERLARAWDRYPSAGVGVGLGPARGPGGTWLLDVEGDGPEAEESLASVFDGEVIDTLGWSSRRGAHRLFAADEAIVGRLAAALEAGAVEEAMKGVFKVAGLPGLEFRVSGFKRARGGESTGAVKQLQSVVPPTPGEDGQPRVWFPCQSLATWPESATEAIRKLCPPRTAPSKPAPRAVPGDRNSPTSPEAIARIRDALQFLPADDYGEWICVGLCLSELKALGLALWDEWSRSSSKFVDGECEKKWASFSPDGGATVGSLIMKARAAGWRDPWDRTNRRERPKRGAEPGRLRVVRPDGPGPEVRPAAGAGEAAGRAEPEDSRPIVEVVADMHLTVEAAVAALAREEALYQRGGRLVAIVHDPEGRHGLLEFREGGSPRIGNVPAPRLAEFLSRSARFAKFDGRSRELVPARVPEWCVESVLSRGEWPNVRPIEGIVEAPTLRPDGTILDRPGYDEATGLVYSPNAVFPRMPDAPGREDAATAAGRLFDLVEDFPFAGPEHKAAWLGGLLTVVGRFAVPGPVPLFLLDANVPGAGKTWLADLVSIIATGREMPRSSYADDDVEMGKVILSVALGGTRVILFDNVPTGFRIGGGSLDRALTARTVQGRILGKTEMSPETPLDAVFFASGNNIGLRGDALRRVIPCRLESPHERPEERKDFRVGDIKGHTRRHRGELLADALTILKAHHAAGRPESGLTPMSYPEWCRVVRDAVHWATGLDPAGPRLAARENDEGTLQRRVLVEGWARLCRTKETAAMGAREAIAAAAAGGPELEDLRELFASLADDGKTPSIQKLGNLLSRERGRPTPYGSLEKKTVRGAPKWFVKVPRGPAPG